MRNLAIFDIDGTLTQTKWIDHVCFREAYANQIDIDAHETRLRHYEHMTDSHIVDQAFKRVFGRAPEPQEVARLQRDAVAAMQCRYAEDRSHFAPVPGAAEAVQRIAATDGWSVALATGGWRLSATFKLNCIGIDADAFPAAFGDDHETREGIVQTAIARARDVHRIDEHYRVVALGDAVWDVVAARNLGIAFIGIAEDDRADALWAAGARHVIADYRDFGQVTALLGQARVPVDPIV